ncbi:TPA: DUF4062 domain-containing protein [Vibrio parahaemolyticus]
MDKRYQVFVSSTFKDLVSEREVAVQSLMRLDCFPSGMELFPAADVDQFEFIKTVISDCDYYLLIIGGKYGTITEEGVSYTEKEYDYAISKNIPVLAFLHKNPEKLPVESSEVTIETRNKLDLFRSKVSKGRLVEFWENKDQLSSQIIMGILSAKKMHPAVGWVKANQTSSAEILTEINELRKENQSLRNELKNKKSNENDDSILNLADLGQLVKVGVETYSSDKFSPIEMSWAEILKSLTPLLFSSLSDYQIMQEILKLWLEKSGDKDINNISHQLKVNETDFNSIKVQFIAFDFVDIYMTHSRDIDGDGEYLEWHITDKGKSALLNLVAIKNAGNE